MDNMQSDTQQQSRRFPTLYLKIFALCTILAVNMTVLHAQTAFQPQNDMASSSASFNQHNVVHVVGLVEVKPNVSGDLKLSPVELTFSNKDISTSIPRGRIINAFIGDQSTEPWGTTGKIARKVIPFGGGAALGAITNKKVDLLTVEYRDIHDGYHGVVFVLPVQKAAAARDRILANLTIPVEQPTSSCTEAVPGSVLVAPIQVRGVELPAEYRILIYEQMIKELNVKQPQDKFFRVGDRTSGAGCAAFSLNIIVTDFKKGNRGLRASTGPVGFFIGKTSLTFDVSLTDANNKAVFNAQIKKSERSDSESLGLADTIAKNVGKQLDKATKNQAVHIASR